MKSLKSPQVSIDSHVQFTQTLPIEYYSGQCVCRICTCNNHRCPPSCSRYDPQIMKTTFQKDYVPHEPQSPSYRVKDQRYIPSRYSPELMKTTFQSDFTPKKSNDPNKSFKKYDSTPYPFPFNGESEYQANYIPKDFSQTFPLSNSHGNLTLSSIPFQGKSTYTVSYQGKKGIPEKQYSTQISPIYSIPFNGSTVCQDDYTQKTKIDNQRRHIDQYIPNNIPFEGQSQYQDSYINFGQGSYQKCHCPVNDLPPMPASCYPGKSHINYNSQQNNWE